MQSGNQLSKFTNNNWRSFYIQPWPRPHRLMLHKMALAADAFPAFPQALRLSGGGRCPSCPYNIGVFHSQRKDNQPLNEDTLGYFFGIHWRYPSHLNTKKLQGNHSPKCIKLSHGGLLQFISFGCLIRFNIQLKADHPLPAFLAHPLGGT